MTTVSQPARVWEGMHRPFPVTNLQMALLGLEMPNVLVASTRPGLEVDRWGRCREGARRSPMIVALRSRPLRGWLRVASIRKKWALSF
jgi:hypothetical protein